MVRQVRGGRVAALVAIVVLLLGSGGGTASADTVLGGHGLRGPHALRDSAQRPGALCTYGESSSLLRTILVRAPRIRARDVTAARDHQRVSWTVTIQYWDVNGYWGQGVSAGPWTATAWDDRVAAFGARTVAAPIGLGGLYRVVVTMRWFRGGAVEGLDRHLVDYVEWVVADSGTGHGPGGSCPEYLPGG